MPWKDRLREAAYTSPSGKRLTFDFENVTQEFTKRTTAFEFPDVDGTFIQELGNGGRRYLLRVILWGSDYDLAANEFEDALRENGIGRLEHPIYGVFNVVPFGVVTRKDDLKTSRNQATITVTFWETTGLVYPTTGVDLPAEVVASVESYNTAAAAEFEETIGLDTETEKATFKNEYTALLDSVSTRLATVAAAQDNVEAQFSAVEDSIRLGIDTLVGEPLTLAFQTMILIQAPARAAAAVWDRLTAYADLLSSLVTPGAQDTPAGFRTADLYASTYLSAAALSAVNNNFATKTEALVAAEYILGQFDALVAWRDENIEALEVVDTGEAYQQLQNAISVVAGYLVEISFTLKQERVIIVDRPRTAVDLAAELYGEVDGQLDFLINSNSLTGSEILEIPRGREIVYYV